MAGLINVLEQFYQSGGSTTPVLGTATKHWDNIWISRHYNWHPGTYKNVYTHVGSYRLKKDAPDDAVNMLASMTPAKRHELKQSVRDLATVLCDAEMVSPGWRT